MLTRLQCATSQVQPRGTRGFTLVELSVVVVVLALLLGSLLYPLSTQVQQRNVGATQKSLDEAREALMGYAMANGRLPCPDTDGDGNENARTLADPASDGCAGGVYVGTLPWATLGVAQVDAWGNRFRYRVTNEFTRRNGDPSADPAACPANGSDPNPCTLQISDAGTLQVNGRNAQTKATLALAGSVPAVVISLGKNGYGAVHQDGSSQPAVPASNTDERTNTAAATTAFLSRTPTESTDTCSDTTPGQPFCEFDDQVIWVPVGILMNRMVAAGRLP